MKTIKITMRKCFDVTIIAEVTDQEFKNPYGLGYLDDSDLGLDAEGFNAVTKHEKMETDSSDWIDIEWEEVE
jgi:hypothetical protein